MNRLHEKIAVVTGGTSGIGRAAALLLAQEGARVSIGDVRLHPENDDQFAALGIRQRECDVRNIEQLRQLIDEAARDAGRLDILVNNAGVVMSGQVDQIEEADWDLCLDTNLKAAFFGMKYALPHMRRAGGGAIVNTASNAGILPRAHDPVYSISKLALTGLTRSLALCHARDRIRINAVCPGPVSETEIIAADIAAQSDRDAAVQQLLSASPMAQALGRMVTPEEVAQAILYLVSDEAAMVTGTLVAIDGGKSLGVPPGPMTLTGATVR